MPEPRIRSQQERTQRTGVPPVSAPYKTDDTNTTLRAPLRAIDGGKSQSVPSVTFENAKDVVSDRKADWGTDEVLEVEGVEDHESAPLTAAAVIDRLQETIGNAQLDLRMLQVNNGMSVEAFAQRVIDQFHDSMDKGPEAIRRNAKVHGDYFASRLPELRQLPDIESLTREQIEQLRDDTMRGILSTVLDTLTENQQFSDSETARAMLPEEDQTATVTVQPVQDLTATAEFKAITPKARDLIKPTPSVAVDAPEDQTTTVIEQAAVEAPVESESLMQERSRLIVDLGIATLPMEIGGRIDYDSIEVKLAVQQQVAEREAELRHQEADGSFLLSEENEALLEAYEDELEEKLNRLKEIDAVLFKGIPEQATEETTTDSQEKTDPETKQLQQNRERLLAYFGLPMQDRTINPDSPLFRAFRAEVRAKKIRDLQASGLNGQELSDAMLDFDEGELEDNTTELLLTEQQLADMGVLQRTVGEIPTPASARRELPPLPDEGSALDSALEVPKEEIQALQQERKKLLKKLFVRNKKTPVDSDNAEWRVLMDDAVGRFSLDHNRDEVEAYKKEVAQMSKDLENIDARLTAAGASLIAVDTPQSEVSTEKNNQLSDQDEQWFSGSQLADRTNTVGKPEMKTPPRTPNSPSPANTIATRRKQERLADLYNRGGQGSSLLGGQYNPQPNLTRRNVERTITPSTQDIARVQEQLPAVQQELTQLQSELTQLMAKEKQMIDGMTRWKRSLSNWLKAPRELEDTRARIKAITDKGTELASDIASMQRQLEQYGQTNNQDLISTQKMKPVAAPEQHFDDTVGILMERRKELLQSFGLDTDSRVVQAKTTSSDLLREAKRKLWEQEARVLEQMAVKEKARSKDLSANLNIGKDLVRFEEWLNAQERELQSVERQITELGPSDEEEEAA